MNRNGVAHLAVLRCFRSQEFHVIRKSLEAGALPNGESAELPWLRLEELRAFPAKASHGHCRAVLLMRRSPSVFEPDVVARSRWFHVGEVVVQVGSPHGPNSPSWIIIDMRRMVFPWTQFTGFVRVMVQSCPGAPVTDLRGSHGGRCCVGDVAAVALVLSILAVRVPSCTDHEEVAEGVTHGHPGLPDRLELARLDVLDDAALSTRGLTLGVQAALLPVVSSDPLRRDQGSFAVRLRWPAKSLTVAEADDEDPLALLWGTP